MIERLLEPLRRSRSAVLHPPAPAARVAALDLSEDHRSFLRATNGVEVYGGYLRLHGIDREDSADLLVWNDPETWKFAWPPDVRGYRSIGQTAWGDQLAYAPDGGGTIVLIDGDDGEVEPWADDFAELLADIVAVDADPHDERLTAARRRLGDLPTDVLLAHVPSPLLGGDEAVERLLEMPARAALITKGDILTQARPSGRHGPRPRHVHRRPRPHAHALAARLSGAPDRVTHLTGSPSPGMVNSWKPAGRCAVPETVCVRPSRRAGVSGFRLGVRRLRRRRRSVDLRQARLRSGPSHCRGGYGLDPRGERWSAHRSDS